ncbi:accessory Sec system glycosylation chaperone GtfB [Gemella sp. GH3]|uniref:accessory Sec system glycosylation chaperone GtfB n=1 Tax=unclassified Gemella TaxID=2624949 RepID=UPI0015CFF477|nr:MULTISPECIES: accessory Sec system glycosylation chaperone GtfB [unclassified Gemella]MBF0714046.1 accessory Sec system glycosylation chaperone GtfB [Gemella sp. GH3.1]NYS50998.1 accessory Sec system glycosylation chaperone GtfB [Gemella sp. GH3]
MINLFEYYSQETKDLHDSLQRSGYDNKTVVINYDGFAPENVSSPYEYFMYGNKEIPENPRYFNQIEVPLFWEIRGNNSYGEIYNFDNKKANIYYTTPTHKRIVSEVEWLDNNNIVRSKDYYNKYGYRYANSIYSKDGELITTSYYKEDGKEVIVENHITNDIILNEDQGKIKIFKSKLELLDYYIYMEKLTTDKIIYNNLSLPFLYSFNNADKSGNDTLVWQEPIHGELPGNMQLILNSTETRTKNILISDKQVYEKIMQLANEDAKEKIQYLGYVYNFVRENNNNPKILILTNSDQIEKIEDLLSELPDFHFYVAAITEMSPKLLSLVKYPNITLFQNVEQPIVKKLFANCDYYLDINYSNEILNAIRTAFENNMIIYGFNNTIHNNKYIAENNIYSPDNFINMVESIKKAKVYDSYRMQLLESQRLQASSVNPEHYKKVLK